MMLVRLTAFHFLGENTRVIDVVGRAGLRRLFGACCARRLNSASL